MLKTLYRKFHTFKEEGVSFLVGSDGIKLNAGTAVRQRSISTFISELQ